MACAARVLLATLTNMKRPARPRKVLSQANGIPAGAAERSPIADNAEHALADQLHSAAIHLLRRLRRQDAASGLSGPRLSALSVVVFGGPIALGDLAAAEQVRAPTMTRLVHALEGGGYVRRERDATDRRLVRVVATTRGKALLLEGRDRRVEHLAQRLSVLSTKERADLARGAELLQALARSLD